MADTKDNKEQVKQNLQVEQKQDEISDQDLDKAAGGLLLYW